MVYQNKFVVAIKVHGQILREDGDTVALPFGAEYSVLVKNLNAVRAQFKLSIDGAETTSGGWIVVSANGSVEMERFIKDGNWDSGNRFKFIERTAEVEAHRGVKADDGLVRVEYRVEVVRPVIPVPHYEPYPVPWLPPHPPPRPPFYPRPPIRPRYGITGPARAASLGASSGKREVGRLVPPSRRLRSDVGITVPGSISDQRFVPAEFFQTGNSEVIVLRLRGHIGAKPVTSPITVKTQAVCSTCGKKSKPGQFCQRCGTALEVV